MSYEYEYTMIAAPSKYSAFYNNAHNKCISQRGNWVASSCGLNSDTRKSNNYVHDSKRVFINHAAGNS